MARQACVFEIWKKIAAIARDMHQALASHDWEDVARLLRRSGNCVARNAPDHHSLIDKLIAVRVERADGREGLRRRRGGCVLMMVEEGAQEAVSNGSRSAGGQILAA